MSGFPDPATTDWVPLWPVDLPTNQSLIGTYAARPAATAVPAGSTYFATDALGTWRSDNSVWTLVGQRAPLITAATMLTAPWSTPYDGMEVVLVDAIANPAYRWHLRYNATSSSAYKWEYVGGTEWVNYSSTNQQVAVVNTWQNITASAIAPPRTGDYVLRGAVQASHPSAGATSYIIFWAGSLPGGTFGAAMATGFPMAGGYSANLVIGPFVATLTGGNGVAIAAQNNIANGNFSSIQYSLVPLRV